jgi:hypothetical protein
MDKQERPLAYKRSTNNEFNIHLAKRMRDRKPDGGRTQSNAERSQANVDAWLKDLEEHRAKGEPTAFEQATQKTLDSFKDRSTAWWWYRMVREILTQCSEFITRRAEAVVRLAKRIAKRTY